MIYFIEDMYVEKTIIKLVIKHMYGYQIEDVRRVYC